MKISSGTILVGTLSIFLHINWALADEREISDSDAFVFPEVRETEVFHGDDDDPSQNQLDGKLSNNITKAGDSSNITVENTEIVSFDNVSTTTTTTTEGTTTVGKVEGFQIIPSSPENATAENAEIVSNISTAVEEPTASTAGSVEISSNVSTTAEVTTTVGSAEIVSNISTTAEEKARIANTDIVKNVSATTEETTTTTVTSAEIVSNVSSTTTTTTTEGTTTVASLEDVAQNISSPQENSTIVNPEIVSNLTTSVESANVTKNVEVAQNISLPTESLPTIGNITVEMKKDVSSSAETSLQRINVLPDHGNETEVKSLPPVSEQVPSVNNTTADLPLKEFNETGLTSSQSTNNSDKPTLQGKESVAQEASHISLHAETLNAGKVENSQQQQRSPFSLVRPNDTKKDKDKNESDHEHTEHVFERSSLNKTESIASDINNTTEKVVLVTPEQNVKPDIEIPTNNSTVPKLNNPVNISVEQPTSTSTISPISSTSTVTTTTTTETSTTTGAPVVNTTSTILDLLPKNATNEISLNALKRPPSIDHGEIILKPKAAVTVEPALIPSPAPRPAPEEKYRNSWLLCSGFPFCGRGGMPHMKGNVSPGLRSSPATDGSSPSSSNSKDEAKDQEVPLIPVRADVNLDRKELMKRRQNFQRVSDFMKSITSRKSPQEIMQEERQVVLPSKFNRNAAFRLGVPSSDDSDISPESQSPSASSSFFTKVFSWFSFKRPAASAENRSDSFVQRTSSFLMDVIAQKIARFRGEM